MCSSSPSCRHRPRSPVRYSVRPGRPGEGVGHEPLGRELRAVQVAARDPVAPDVHLPRHPDRARPAPARPVCAPACWRSGGRWRSPAPAAPPSSTWTTPSSRSARTCSTAPPPAPAAAAPDPAAGPRRRTSALNPGPPRQPASISSRQVAGVACITVAWLDSSSPRRAWPSTASSRLASTTCRPTASGSSSSSTAMSKLSVVTATSRSAALRPGSCAMLTRKFTTARCGTTTPLGLPVEPEV